jgi:ELWxxDGT repeat protein
MFEGLETRRVPAAVSLVKDINPGGDSNPQELTVVGNTLFFTANWPGAGEELVKSDGTAAGTALVKDIRPGAAWSSPYDLVNAGGRLFFLANDGVHGDELWTSDGTPQGTILLKDVNASAVRDASQISYLTAVGNSVYFVADDGVIGAELWMSDGTPQGTRLARDIRPGRESSRPYGLTAVGNALYFAAWDGELEDDGFGGLIEAPGLYRVVDGNVTLVGRSGVPGGIALPGETIDSAAFNGEFYYLSGGNLWKSNGTPGGTALVATLNSDIYASTAASLLVNVGGVLYFNGDDGVNGWQIWESDGTGGGTRMVTDLAGGIQMAAAAKGTMVAAGGWNYFSATTPETGYELWRTNGIVTQLVFDLVPGPGDAFPRFLTELGGGVFYNAIGQTGRSGLYMFGTGGVNTPEVPINAGASEPFPAWLTRMGDAIYFGATDSANGRELRKVTLGGPVVGPPLVRLARVKPVWKRGMLSSVTVSFDGAPNPMQRIDTSAIVLVRAGKDKMLGTKDDLVTKFRAVKIDRARVAVVLTPPSRVSLKQAYALRVDGSRIKDLQGRGIDADKDGTPGGLRLIPLTTREWKES